MRTTRRTFLCRTTATLAAVSLPVGRTAEPSHTQPNADLHDRIEGLLAGSFIGDALGGPVEFQDPDRVRTLPRPPKVWTDDEVLDEEAIDAASARLCLRSYADLRPEPESYAHWTPNAAPGTVTDDSRHKLVLLDGLRRTELADTWPFDVRSMARAYLEWPKRPTIQSRSGYRQLTDDWLEEWIFSARWVLGERDPNQSLPPTRMWNGLPTCCGQMTLPPLAAVFAGRPTEAYRVAYHLAFFDNGWGRDLNAAFVAALARALATPVAPEGETRSKNWDPILAALRRTDPFRYGEVPWTQRSVDRWLDLAHRLARDADRRPARLFAALNREFRQTIKWEAQVPFVVTFAVLELADYHPLAALQLSIEWGHDTDSYAQMVGALVGALHGTKVFPREMRETVARRLRLDYAEELEDQVELLDRLRRRTAREPLFGERVSAAEP